MLSFANLMPEAEQKANNRLERASLRVAVQGHKARSLMMF